jgi:hypothetical protein
MGCECKGGAGTVDGNGAIRAACVPYASGNLPAWSTLTGDECYDRANLALNELYGKLDALDKKSDLSDADGLCTDLITSPEGLLSLRHVFGAILEKLCELESEIDMLEKAFDGKGCVKKVISG